MSTTDMPWLINVDAADKANHTRSAGDKGASSRISSSTALPDPAPVGLAWETLSERTELDHRQPGDWVSFSEPPLRDYGNDWEGRSLHRRRRFRNSADSWKYRSTYPRPGLEGPATACRNQRCLGSPLARWAIPVRRQAGAQAGRRRRASWRRSSRAAMTDTVPPR